MYLDDFEKAIEALRKVVGDHYGFIEIIAGYGGGFTFRTEKGDGNYAVTYREYKVLKYDKDTQDWEEVE